ncbi:hypothetical protein [Streptomyces solicathayae]|uniref:Lipoprotein n=1 Tax=Streptomyces solicathayae TaxID=3081768 RepID=A0ABZ0LVA1_9ACTN|nr:hypothetical protein [Streptomyces sp. HUAS YS2]WOX23424.1 hypothetical protein R2D22_19310 [Streptomyces sp. HUAS YS2]
MLVLLATALAAAGCGADRPDRPDRPDRADRPGSPGSPGSPEGAGARVVPSAADRRYLKRAEQILIAECLRAQGFAYEARTLPDEPPRRFPYVLDDVAWARRHGYGLDEERRIAARKAADPNERYFRGLPPERQKAALAALNGARPEGLSARMPGGGVVVASDEGCTARAQRRLYGDLQGWFAARLTVANLTPLYVPKVREDPEFRRAVGGWARCMAGRGHRYATPDALREALPGVRTRAAEIRLAVAEAGCAGESGLAATAKALDARYGAEVRRRYAGQIATELRLARAAVPRAREVLHRRP